MENGSFQSHEPENVRTTDELVRNIPLPNEMPRGMDFLDVPAPSLKSSALENLIGQNEDLMARLSVALRKTNELEETQSILQRENQTFRGKFESLREQFLVLKEKDRRFTERTRELSEQANSSREAMQQLEKVYAELYTQAKAFQRRVVKLERYRVRVRKAKGSVQKLAKRVPGLEMEAIGLEKEVTRLESNLIESRKILTASHIQAVNNYENKLAAQAEKIELLQAKADERDQIFDDNVRIKNETVFTERQLEQTRQESQSAIQKLSEETRSLRVELKENLVVQATMNREMDLLKAELPELKTENQALREQVESLQALWSGKQRELEQADEKNASLQKLNQSLGATLNQQRRDLQAQKDVNEQDNFKYHETVKKLLAEIQMLRTQMSES